jgi:VWFA-related protein
MLDQLLAGHGLKTERGPKDTLLVVRAKQAASIHAGSMVSDTIASKQVAAYVVVPFVSLYLTAQDSDKHFLTDLTPENLIVKEDGKEQTILDFLNLSKSEQLERIPVSAYFLIDTSQSTTTEVEGIQSYDLFKQGALMMLNHFEAGDQLSVLGFSERGTIISPMSRDIENIRQKIQGMGGPSGKTALYDTLLQVLSQLDEFAGRKVVVIFSDGRDNFSHATLNDLTAALKSSDVTLFAFGTSSRDALSLKGREVLEKITEQTGGYSFFPTSLQDLRSLIEQVHSAIGSQYAAGYIPPDPSVHKWRQVEIKCRIPGVHLRYRKSYLF